MIEISSIKPRWWFQIFFLCSPPFGELIHFDYVYNVIQKGWNRQLETANLPKKGNDSLTPFSTYNQPLLNKKIDSIEKWNEHLPLIPYPREN